MMMGSENNVPLEMDFLRHYGWPVSWVNMLRQCYGDYFLPIQQRAIQQGGLFEEKNLVVSGPTSCGKGLIGELAALHQLHHNRPALMVVPTKALARQRLEELQSRWGRLGLKVVQSTRDHREHDSDIARGRYHLAVAVAEKVLALLSSEPHLFATTGAVIFDEVQMLYDSERGGDLELLITRLLREEHLQLATLSAVMESPGDLTEWLGAELIEETGRPVELRQGILFPVFDGPAVSARYKYREFNSGKEGVEQLPDVSGENEEELTLGALRQMAEAGQMCLLFCSSREASFAWADRLSQELDECPAGKALADLETLEDNLVTQSLRRFLSRGVAVHNSDLSWPQRKLVEQAAERGEIRILCSTSTLSEGVNLPVVNTFIPRTLYRSRQEDLQRGRPPRAEQISRSHFRNMIGRSARLGRLQLSENQSPGFGRGILVTAYPGEVDTLLRVYLEEPGSPERPHLLNAPPGQAVLKLAATGSALTLEECREFLADSLSGLTEPLRLPSPEEMEEVVLRLRDQDFLSMIRPRLEISPLGLVAARSGVLPETLSAMRQYAGKMEPVLPAEVLLRIALSDDGQRLYLPLGRAEWRSRALPRELFRRLEIINEHERPGLQGYLNSPEAASETFASAVKKTLLMWDWISDRPTVDIEQRYRVLTGHIEKLADGFSWLIRTLSETAFVEGVEESARGALDRLADCLRYGLPEKALGLSPLFSRGLNRTAILQLHHAGLETPEEVTECSREEIEDILGPGQARWLMKEETRPEEPAVEAAPVQAPPEDEKAGVVVDLGQGIRLRIDEQRPDRLYFDGRQVEVTGTEFAMVQALARHSGQCVPYERLLNIVWPDAMVEQQQISSHKSHLMKKARQVLGEDAPDWIRTVRGVGLLLEGEIQDG
jgi:replicative superfamily II helicase